jgi:hypothetical protein
MASQKISQLTAITTVASGDYFPIVQALGVTNQRVEVGVLDARYTLAASGVAAQNTANTALSSGNAALASASTKYAISGGLLAGQVTTVITSLGLNGSGIPCSSGNYFTATLSGNSSVYFTDIPSNSYSLTYEVRHDTGTITWPGSVSWPSATAPTLTTGKTHLFMFVTDDAGTSWRAASQINYTT